jgi:hypothetical protein
MALVAVLSGLYMAFIGEILESNVLVVDFLDE